MDDEPPLDEPRAPCRRGPQARAARNDRALLEAAREVFLSQGFDAPVAAVAERAGVGMGSLYRRYRTKEELFQRLSLDSLERVAGAARDALDDADPWQGLVDYVERCADFGFGALTPMGGAFPADSPLGRSQAHAQQLTDALVERAHTAGVLRADVTARDVSALVSQLARRSCPGSAPEAEHARRRVLAIALDGLRATAATTPLPADGAPHLNSN